MALDKQVIPISLGGSLDTKTDEKQVLPGDFVTLENAVFTVGKKLSKRPGYDDLGKTVTAKPGATFTNNIAPSTLAAGVYSAPFNSEKLLNDGMFLYSYLDESDTFGYKGRNECLGLSVKSTYKDKYNQKNVDSAVNETSGLKLTAWESYADSAPNATFVSIFFTLEDIDTGQNFFTFVVNGGAGTETRPKCVAISNKLYLLYFTSTDNTVKAVEISKTGIGVATTLVNNIDTTNPNFDAIVNNSLIYLAYNGTGTTIKAASFNSALVNQNTSSTGSQSAPNGITLWADTSNNIWIAWNNDVATKALILSSTLSSVLTTTTIDSGGGDDYASAKNNVTGVYDSVNAKSYIFYDQQHVPVVLNQVTESDGTLVTTDATGFTMPAVGSSVSIIPSDTETGRKLVGQIIYIATAGYMYVSTYAPGLDMYCVNLGYYGNAAPAAAIGGTKAISYVGGYINAVTYYNTLTVGGTVGSNAILCRAAGLVTKSFMTNGAAHVGVCFASNIQPTNFIASIFNNQTGLNTTPAHLPLKIFGGEAGGFPSKSLLAQVNSLSSGLKVVEMVKRVETVTVLAGAAAQVGFNNGVIACTIDPDPAQIAPLAMGKNLHIPSGSLWMYDGYNVVEHNFNYFPESITATKTSSGGYLSAGLYSYKVVYAWTDAQGNTHRSSPSAPFEINVSANDSVTLTIPTLRLTEKVNVVIEVYRTEVNGTVYYNLGNQKANTVLAATVTYGDGLQDSFIIGGQQLYTMSEVQNNQAPSAGVLTSFSNRLALIPYDNPNSYWFSKQVVDGFPVEFSASFVKNISPDGGPTVSAGVMDDKLILFKSRSIYYVVGSGPAPSGANDDLTDPVLITTDTGIEDKASIVPMPYGIMFKSNKGIYLLDRSLQSKYLGAPVESYNADTVNSAVIVKDLNQIRFQTSGGVALVYDYYYDRWSVFTPYSGVSAFLSDGVYCFLKSDGTMNVETAGVYSDNGSYISMKFKTSWLQLSGIQGFQRVWKMLIVGNYFGAHDLNVDIAYDFNGTPTQSEAITGTTVGGVYQWRVNLTRQLCEAIQITVYDTESSGGDNQGMSLSALTFEAGVKRGADKLGATQSYG